MDTAKLLVLIVIALLLMNMRVAIEKWGEEFRIAKVTKVEHCYNYNVHSYGVVKLNDKLVGFVEVD